MGVAYQILFLLGAAFFVFFIGRILAKRPHLLADIPNHRSMHKRVVSRAGGLGLALVFLPGLFSLAWQPNAPAWQALCIGALFFATLGLIDDIRRLSALTRLLLSCLTCSLLLFWVYYGTGTPVDRSSGAGVTLFGLSLQSGWIYGMMLFWLLCCINFFNFMDGSDGLAGLQACWMALVLVSACLLDIQHYSRASEFSVIMMPSALIDDAGIANRAAISQTIVYKHITAQSYLFLAACLTGFLYWNWPRARLFMGDSGSYMLGFTLGFAPVLAYMAEPPAMLAEKHASAFDGAICVLAWLPFLSDAGLTLLRRLLRRENLFQAHRDHLYQRLLQRGWSAAYVLLFYALLNLSLLVLIGCWFFFANLFQG